jgi:hypothetical protein
MNPYSGTDNQQFEPAVEFQYPNEQSQPVIDDTKIRQLLDFLIYYVLLDKDPRMCLLALGFNAGYDIGGLFNTANTIRSIARANGIVHVQLFNKVKQIQSELQLSPRINNGNKLSTIHVSASFQRLS